MRRKTAIVLVAALLLIGLGVWAYLRAYGFDFPTRSPGKVVGQGQNCGGNGLEMNTCAPGLLCYHSSSIADVGGICMLHVEMAGPGEHCGGTVRPAYCRTGYHCEDPDSHLPANELGGTCAGKGIQP